MELSRKEFHVFEWAVKLQLYRELITWNVNFWSQVAVKWCPQHIAVSFVYMTGLLEI
jgi:hypothetical protein